MEGILSNPAESMRTLFCALAANPERRLGYDFNKTRELADYPQQLRTKLESMLGLHVAPRHPQRFEMVGSEHADGFVRHLVRIEGRDGAVIPAYWLVPRIMGLPTPVLLALHGHGPGKAVCAGASQDPQRNDVAPSGDRDFAAQAARRGYLVLAPDLRGFGEMTLPEALQTHRPSTCVEMSMRAIAAGKSLVGMRVLDLMSCVDWLLTRSEVDPSRIVCTGQSGGATFTVWACAMDPRIAAAIPCCGFCTFQHAIMSIHHCPYNCVPGILDVCEFYDLAGLIAPRPLRVIAGAMDPIFPLDGVRKAVAMTREIYAAAGAEHCVQLVVGPEGHRFYSQPLFDFLRDTFPISPRRS